MSKRASKESGGSDNKRKSSLISTSKNTSEKKNAQSGSATDLEVANARPPAEATNNTDVKRTEPVVESAPGSRTGSLIDTQFRSDSKTTQLVGNESISVAHPELAPPKDVTIINAYNMGPPFGGKFPVASLRIMIKDLMTERLTGKVYNISEALKWTRDLADDVNLKMRGEFLVPRYKHVVNVVLYQQTGAGCNYSCRCVWDLQSDDQVSITYDGSSFVCICTVFGVYQY